MSHRKWRNIYQKKVDNDDILGVADDIKIHKVCGCMAGVKAELTIPWDIWQKWLCISSSMKNLEWGAVYDVVSYVGDKKLDIKAEDIVSEFRVPKQTVSGGSCHFEEDLGGNGVVHSHHSMGAFHSAQDDAATRNLYDWSIVLSDKGYEACKRVKMKCGDYTYIPVTLNFTDIPGIKMKNIVEEKPFYTGGYFHGGNQGRLDDYSHFDRTLGTSPCEGCTKDCFGCKEVDLNG